jgi:ATP-dependent DNA helicase RecG
VPLLRYADLEADAELIEPARELAEALLAHDPAKAQALMVRWLGGREALLRA